MLAVVRRLPYTRKVAILTLIVIVRIVFELDDGVLFTLLALLLLLLPPLAPIPLAPPAASLTSRYHTALPL